MKATSPLFSGLNVTSSHVAAEITYRTSCSQEAITGKQQCRRWICFSALPHVTSKEGAGHVAHNFKSKRLQKKTSLNVNIIYWPHRISNYVKHFETFCGPIRNTSIKYKSLCCKGKLLIDGMGQDVIRALRCTVIRLCHTSFTCATDAGDKQRGERLQNTIA